MGIRLAMLGIAAIVAALALALIPGEAERSAILVRDGRIGDALAHVVKRGAPGSADQRLALMHVQLLRRVGNFEGAMAQLEDYISRAPDDLPAHLALMQLAEELGHEQRLLTVAGKLFEHWRRDSAYLVLLRHHQQRDNQEALLDLLRNSAFVGLASIGDIERLALMEAALGRKDAALQHLVDVDATRVGLTSNGRLVFLDLLIGADRFQQRGHHIVAQRLHLRRRTFGLAICGL